MLESIAILCNFIGRGTTWISVNLNPVDPTRRCGWASPTHLKYRLVTLHVVAQLVGILAQELEVPSSSPLVTRCL